jgi:hypothetical protein
MPAQPMRSAVRPDRVRAILLVWVAASTLLAGFGSSRVSGQTPETPPAQLSALDDVPLTQYRAYRRMHATNPKFNQEAWLEAWTEWDRQGFRYEVVSERGSEYLRNKVLKTVLTREQELIAQGKADRAELSLENYDFEQGPDGAGVRYVLLKPKRKDMLLVDGRMVLNQTGTEVLRIEGRLSKNPSFWTSLVNVIRDFARIHGVRVPVTTETIARVKLAGLSRMLIEYEYESINGRPVALSARRGL